MVSNQSKGGAVSQAPTPSKLTTVEEKPAQARMATTPGAASIQTPTQTSTANTPGDMPKQIQAPSKRPERRYGPAGPKKPGTARQPVAANDDLPSIGGLIYALQQRPSKSAFYFALGFTFVWLLLCGSISFAFFNAQLAQVSSIFELLSNPTGLGVTATLVIPIAIFWFLALLVWRAQELRLMASAMTEVAVRLAEPDRLAEQSIASVGQTIRRQVAAVNDAISRAMGRAGELEALLHNELATLERSYNENELRVRGLISNLASERQALANNSERVSESLRGIGTQVSKDIAYAGDRATKSLTSATTILADQLTVEGDKITAAVSEAGLAVANNSERVSESLRGIGTQVSKDIAYAGDRATKSLTSATTILADQLTVEGDKITAAVSEAGLAVDNKLAERGAAIVGQIVNQGRAITKTFDGAGLAVDNKLAERGAAIVGQIVNQGRAITKTFDGAGATLAKVMEQTTDRVNEKISINRNELFRSLSQVSERIESRVPGLIQSLDKEQTKLSTVLVSTANNIGRLETSVSQRVDALDKMLAQRTIGIQSVMSTQAQIIDEAMVKRTEVIRFGLIERIQALDTSLVKNAAAVQKSLVHHTNAYNQMLAEGTKSFRKTSEQMSRQSGEALQGLSTQADTLKVVSKNIIDQIHSLTQRFENQGQAIISAARALDSSNAQIDSILERPHAEIGSLLDTVGTKTQDLDKQMRSYSGQIEHSLVQAENRAKQLGASLAEETEAQTRITIPVFEQRIDEALSHTVKAAAEIKHEFETLPNQFADQTSMLTKQAAAANLEMQVTAPKTASEIDSNRHQIQRTIQDLQQDGKLSLEQMRAAMPGPLGALNTPAPAQQSPIPAQQPPAGRPADSAIVDRD